ncbi:MAG: histidine kinase [Bacteroidales bacterium]
MKALRAQMNPHFLFNSLNSIRYYVLQEEFENATGYITKFSKLLRLILHNSRQNSVTLSEEPEMVRIYIEFEQMRYDNKL